MVLALVDRADWRTDMCIQAVVIAGVWYMSACKCDMLVDAEKDMGTAGYTAGNFLIHYFPLVSATARRKQVAQKPEPTAVLLWLLYNALSVDYGTTPSDTYGCDAPYELVVMLGTATALIATFVTHKTKKWPNLVTTLGQGKQISYKFCNEKVTIVLTVPPAGAKEKQTKITSYVANKTLMKNVHPRGNDGGVIYTAALARHVVNMSSIAGVHHTTEPGVRPSIMHAIDARVIAALAAAFCGLKVKSYSRSMQMAVLGKNVCMAFKGGHVSITTDNTARRMTLPAGAVFSAATGPVLMVSESPSAINTDIVVANVCWTLFAML